MTAITIVAASIAVRHLYSEDVPEAHERQPLTLGAEVGRGGEAAVYKLPSQPLALAKLYHGAPRAGDKQPFHLRRVVQGPQLQHPFRVNAWPGWRDAGRAGLRHARLSHQ